MHRETIENEYLECEQRWVYLLLIAAAGWFGAYTFILRGGVFCNAQTANVVLFAVALGQQRWEHAAYLLIPIGAYFLGAFVSEYLGKTVKRFHFLRWDTLLIGFEILVVIALGLLPESAPRPDLSDRAEFHLLDAVQHLPSGQGDPRGDYLRHEPHPTGGFLCGKIPPSPRPLLQREAAHPRRTDPLLRSGRCAGHGGVYPARLSLDPRQRGHSARHLHPSGARRPFL